MFVKTRVRIRWSPSVTNGNEMKGLRLVFGSDMVPSAMHTAQLSTVTTFATLLHVGHVGQST